jgi:hypothetical protein
MEDDTAGTTTVGRDPGGTGAVMLGDVDSAGAAYGWHGWLGGHRIEHRDRVTTWSGGIGGVMMVATVGVLTVT